MNANDARDALDAADDILGNEMFGMDDEEETEERGASGKESGKSDNNDEGKEAVVQITKTLREYLKPMAIKLFEKYIDQNSEFELNLSSRLRRHCKKKKQMLMKDELTDEQLYHIFDSIIKAMMKLMIDSLVRFKLTKVKHIIYIIALYVIYTDCTINVKNCKLQGYKVWEQKKLAMLKQKIKARNAAE